MKRQVNRTFDSANTRYNIARILTALQTPQTHRQLRASLHMCERTLGDYLKHLRIEPNRRVRVATFLFLRERWIPVLALGLEPDAVKPCQTENERNAKYRAKVKATPEMDDARKRRNQARWLVRKKKTPQTPFSALFVGVRVALMTAEG